MRGASYESKTDDYQNSCLDLVYAGILFTDIVKYSKVLGVDSERRAKWEDIRDHLNDFSTTSVNGLAVYQADSKKPFDFSQNVIQTQIIYPGYSCNRRSNPKSKQIGFNTILQAAKLAGWGQDNMRGQGFFVAAQRIGGFKVDDLIAHYKEMLLSRPVNFPNYIADAGLWEFNNELCLQCFDREVMFCPDYPAEKRLSFRRLLAPGAFLCSGEFKGGTIAALTVQSQKGNPFTVIEPWGAASQIEVSELGGHPVPTRKKGDTFTFDTDRRKNISDYTTLMTKSVRGTRRRRRLAALFLTNSSVTGFVFSTGPRMAGVFAKSIPLATRCADKRSNVSCPCLSALICSRTACGDCPWPRR